MISDQGRARAIYNALKIRAFSIAIFSLEELPGKCWTSMGVARIFFRRGKHFFKKIFKKFSKKYSKHFQKIFKKYSKKLKKYFKNIQKISKNFKKFQKISKKFSKIFKNFLKKIAKNALF